MIEKVTETISMVFTEDGFSTSHAVLINDDIPAMIDSGVGKIIQEIDTEKIELLINSHCHLDHINGNDHFKNARKLAHPIEREAMLNPEMTTATSGWNDLMTTDREDIARGIGLFNPRFVEPWITDGDISHGEVINFGKTRVKVLHTSGHTKGHCSFHFLEENFIFTGDICLSKVGPWYGEPGVKIQDFLDSIDLIIKLKPDIVSTGHLNTILDKNITRSMKEYKDRINSREEKLVKILKKSPLSIDDLSEKKIIYNDHPTPFVVFWEKSMINNHLNKLIDDGIADMSDDGIFYLV